MAEAPLRRLALTDRNGYLSPLNSPHRTEALVALCERLNETRARFPGSKLHLRFDVKPDPPPSLAFPGPRRAKTAPVEAP